MDNPNIARAAVLMSGGLGMVVCGGCFLSGVMLVISNPFCVSSSPTELSSFEQTFVRILYALAFASFSVAAMLIWTAVRRLNR